MFYLSDTVVLSVRNAEDKDFCGRYLVLDQLRGWNRLKQAFKCSVFFGSEETPGHKQFAGL